MTYPKNYDLALSEDEQRQLKALRNSASYRLPKHLAIIMDGNGRWAKKHGLTREQGHRVGAERLRHIVQAVDVLGLENLTVYAFSTENWSRPYTEIRALMKLFTYFFEKYDAELAEADVKIRMLGEYDPLPPGVKKTWDRAVRGSKDRQGLCVNVAYNYGGRRELLRAAQAFALAAKSRPELLETDDDEALREFLYAPDVDDPDFLIRTSGEFRLSNFLLWQLAYTEFYSTPLYWPDFTAAELIKALDSYQGRDRRYGGLSDPSSKGGSKS